MKWVFVKWTISMELPWRRGKKDPVHFIETQLGIYRHRQYIEKNAAYRQHSLETMQNVHCRQPGGR